MTSTPKIAQFLKGARWRATANVSLLGERDLKDGEEFIVATTCNTTHSMWMRIVNEDGSLSKKLQICHWPTPWTFDLVEQSKETFYTLRLKDGRLMRDGTGQMDTWRYGNVKLYHALRGAINRLAVDCSLSETEVIAFKVNAEGEMVDAVAQELPEGWAERVQRLLPLRVRLGADLMKDEWEVALVFNNTAKDGLFDANRRWKIQTNSKIKFANNLSRRWRDPWVFLFKRRMDAIKHRLALPDCEMVSLRA